MSPGAGCGGRWDFVELLKSSPEIPWRWRLICQPLGEALCTSLYRCTSVVCYLGFGDLDGDFRETGG